MSRGSRARAGRSAAEFMHAEARAVPRRGRRGARARGYKSSPNFHHSPPPPAPSSLRVPSSFESTQPDTLVCLPRPPRPLP